MKMFGAPFLPEKCVITAASAQIQRESRLFYDFFFPPLSTLQFSKNIRMLISLLCGCVCESVFGFLRKRVFVCVCVCVRVYRRMNMPAMCVCAKVRVL